MNGAGLVAVTRRIDDDVDLLDVAGDDGVAWVQGRAGHAGRGVAARIAVPRDDPATAAKAVHDALDGIEVDDDVDVPGSGPVAIGALPFSPGAPGELVVPALAAGRAADGTGWITAVSRDGAEPSLDGLFAPPGSAVGEPSRYEITSERDPQEWCDAVAAARGELSAEGARKVVLARALEVRTDVPLAAGSIMRRLRSTYPSCMLFQVDRFVGASPELLVARTHDRVRSHPMAGTAPRSSDPTTDARLAAELMSSTKDQVEHRLTIDMVHDTLLPWCSYLDEEAEPSIVAMANVQHLATQVEGRLSHPPASVIELMVALHPTPAVAGAPRAHAFELIDRYELLDRGRFAGPVGWVDRRGNGAWAVGIRCAELEPWGARLFAGVGVLPDSDPVAELAETRAKLQALLSAIVHP